MKGVHTASHYLCTQAKEQRAASAIEASNEFIFHERRLGKGTSCE